MEKIVSERWNNHRHHGEYCWIPYGWWESENNRTVIFNRQYCPIWEKTTGNAWVEANHCEWVNAERQNWFFEELPFKTDVYQRKIRDAMRRLNLKILPPLQYDIGKEELYRHYDKLGNLLYVGISDNVVQRYKAHKATNSWYVLVSKITIERYATREDVRLAEAMVIIGEEPKLNIQFRGLDILAFQPTFTTYKLERQKSKLVKDNWMTLLDNS